MLAGVVVSLISCGFFESYETSYAKLKDFFNEIIIVLTLYTMMCFTNFLPDQMMQFNVGYVSCFLVATHLIINLVFMVKSSTHQVILNLKRFFYQRKHKPKKLLGVAPTQYTKEALSAKAKDL